MTIDDARDRLLALLATRAEEATLCPSEVARAMTAGRIGREADDWRDAMPVVHAAVDDLVTDGQVRLSWKGKVLDARAGPYRIGRSGRG